MRMARTRSQPPATRHVVLEPYRSHCLICGGTLWADYHTRRTLTTLEGRTQLVLTVRRCHNPDCQRYHQPYRPEEEGAWALPQSETGLDVVALAGTLRFGEHRSVPEIRQQLRERGILLAERTVTNLVYRYEELVALRLADQDRLRDRLRGQGRVLLALDGLAPDVGHEVLWVLRDCLSGEVLLARSLLSATTDDLAVLLKEVHQALLPIPIAGVVSDGQWSIRKAVRSALPGVPHQLCHFHYLREAALPIYEADRHAKKELKKQVRGVRPIEREVEGQTGPAAEATRRYCLAVRSALTDDGRPPLAASGLHLYERLQAVSDSLERAAEKGGCPGR
jgi:hypothetical protein